MGPLPWTTRFRLWLAFSIILRVLWWTSGEKPQFCDLADSGCPLYQPGGES